MTVRPLFALPALALLAACAREPAPMATPVAVAPPPPVMAPAPAPMMSGMDGRYVGTARLVAGSPRSCRARVMNVSANVAGDRVTVINGRNRMDGMMGPGGTVTFSDGMYSNTRFDNGMLMGEAMNGSCRYTVSMRKVAERATARRMR